MVTERPYTSWRSFLMMIQTPSKGLISSSARGFSLQKGSSLAVRGIQPSKGLISSCARGVSFRKGSSQAVRGIQFSKGLIFATLMLYFLRKSDANVLYIVLCVLWIQNNV